MCNRKKLESDLAKLAKRYGAMIDDLRLEVTVEQYAFDHDISPIIKTESPETICTDHHWGLVPASWPQPKEKIWNSTYNAKLEYLHKRKSYKNITHQRCLVPATSYFEYHWNDPKGKTKTLYEIWHPEAEIFTLAGLHSSYVDYDGSIYNSYTVLTTEANDRMRFVHNKDAAKDYHRMPLMLNPEDDRQWLDTKIPYMDFGFPNYQSRMIAEPVQGQAPTPPQQLSLF